MSDDTTKAKLRVEFDNKELKAGFAETKAAAKKLATEVTQALEATTVATQKLAAAVTRDATATAAATSKVAGVHTDAAGRMRDASGKFLAGARSATPEMDRLAQSSGRAGGMLDGLASKMGGAGGQALRFAGTVGGELKSALQGLGSTAASAARGLLALGGIGAGMGLVKEVGSILEIDDAVAGLAASADLAKDKIGGLTDQILQTSLDTKQFGRDLTEGLQAFVAKTGDLEEGRKNLKLYGDTAKATRASVVDIANIGADLNKLNITDQARAFAVLAKQSDVGAVELKDLVSQGPRLLSAFMSAGLTGERGLREGGAFTQVAQSATGNVERTSTSVEAAFRDVVEKQARLHSAGINVFDPKTHLARNRVEVILDVIRKAKGREDYLHGRDGVFGDEAYRAINPLAAEFRKTGGFPSYEKFRDVDADQGVMDRKRELNSSTVLAKIQAAQIQTQFAAHRNLGDSVNAAGDYAGKGAEAFDWATSHPWSAGALAVGATAGAGIAKAGIGAAGRWALGKAGGLLGKRGAGAAVDAAAGALGGAGGSGTPVYITNWPAGGVGGGEGALLDGASSLIKSTAPAIVASSGAAIAAAAAAVLASGAVGYAVGTVIDSKLHLSDKLAGVHGDGHRADSGNFWEDGERRFAAGKNERDTFNKLKGKVSRGELTPQQAADQFSKFAVSAEGAGDVDHISDGTQANKDGTTYGGINARAQLDELTNTRADPLEVRKRKQQEGGVGATGTLAENASLMLDLLGGEGSGAAAGKWLGRARDSVSPSFGGAPQGALDKLSFLGGVFAPPANDAPESTQPPGDLNFTININGDQVTVEGGGTRTPRVMVTRTQGGG